MARQKPQRVAYVTSSQEKIDENRILSDKCFVEGQTKVSDVCSFVIHSLPVKEILEIDLSVMVQAEAISAYSLLKTPCVVEHAGLIFEDLADAGFPGGLTKPMWNALGSRFMDELKTAGRRAVAKAVVAYCDGSSVRVFQGETHGRLADAARGLRHFYWDTIFIPDLPDGTPNTRTYAEIVEDPKYGLEYKVTELSQSSKAMLEFVRYLRRNPIPPLWA